MTSSAISDFDHLVKHLLHARLCFVEKLYGTGLSLEVETLAPTSQKLFISNSWDWRIEQHAKVLAGSSSPYSAIQKTIDALQDLTIESIALSQSVPDLNIKLTNGLACIHIR